MWRPRGGGGHAGTWVVADRLCPGRREPPGAGCGRDGRSGHGAGARAWRHTSRGAADQNTRAAEGRACACTATPALGGPVCSQHAPPNATGVSRRRRPSLLSVSPQLPVCRPAQATERARWALHARPPGVADPVRPGTDGLFSSPPPRPRLMRCSGTATKWPRPKKKGRIATVAQRFRGVAQRAAYCRPLLCTRRRRAACALSDPAHVLTPSSTASSRPDGAPAAAAAHAPPQRPSRGGAPNGKRSSRPACLLEVCVIGQQRCGHCALGRGRAVASACPRTQRGRARMRRPRTQQRTLLGRRRRRKRHLHEVGAAEHARARAARKPVADVRARRLQLRRLRGALRRLSNGERARARGRRLRRARISKV